MPYALPERQREFQRKWAQAKANRERTVQNVDGSRRLDLSKGYVTWEELTGSHSYIAKISTWGDCVKEARSLVSDRRLNRLQVAFLALRGCEIRRGGARTKGEDEPDTLRAFSREIGVHSKTLDDWIAVARMINSFPADVKKEGIDYTSARMTIEKLGRAEAVGAEAFEVYSSFATLDPGVRYQSFIARYIKQAYHHTKRIGVTQIEPVQRELCRKWLVELTALFDRNAGPDVNRSAERRNHSKALYRHARPSSS